MKKKIKDLIQYFLVSVLLISTLLFVFVGIFWTHKIHKPTYCSQVNFLFSDSEGNKYFTHELKLLKLNKSSSEYSVIDNIYNFENIDFKRANFAANDDNLFVFLCPSYYDLNNKINKHFLNTYDKDLNLISSWDCSTFMDILYCFEESNGFLYATAEINGIEGYSLIKCNPLSHSYEVLLKNIDDKRGVFYNDALKIFINSYAEIYLYQDDQKLLFYSKYNKDAVVLNNFVAYYENRGIKVKFQDNLFIFDLDIDWILFYEKAYLIDDKIVFGFYNYNSHELCGGEFNKCYCGYGKSYLYYFSLTSNELYQIGEYEEGSFLIDYDLNGAKYYYDSKLYVDNQFFRNCEEIKEGELEKTRNEFFNSEKDIKQYYLAYYNNEFYGI